MKIFWRDPYFLHYWLPPILWALAILVMSGDVGSAQKSLGLLKLLLDWFVVLKPAQINMVNFYLRKTGHVLAYGLMYFLWFRAFRGHLSADPGRSFLYALGLCLLVSMTDEAHQSFTKFRGGSGYDVLLDLSGASLAALITFAVWTPRPKAAALAGPDGRHPAGPG
ncbi:MAG: VanZ family protein [Desulfobaccales bacterium]